jgi:exopolyphosphatase/guanosine-5'-triphosphate,3'-diphosphate pyrophosphatase
MVHQLAKEKRDLADQLSVTTAQLREMSDRLGGLGLEERRQLPGVGPRRAEVIVAGCRVLARIAELLSLPGLCYSSAGVRDGVIADLAARGIGQHESRLDGDQRNVVREMARRYNVAAGHAEQVAAMGRMLFESLESVHKLPPKLGRLLEAACYLHDIGHFVSDTKHHRHSQYIVANSDLPGFTDRERLFVASLCRYHRKSLPVPGHEGLKGLSSSERSDILALVPLLRLADSLDRGHAQRIKNVRAAVDDGTISLLLVGSDDTDLEAWAAQRTGDYFRQVYGAKLIVRGQSNAD